MPLIGRSRIPLLDRLMLMKGKSYVSNSAPASQHTQIPYANYTVTSQD